MKSISAVCLLFITYLAKGQAGECDFSIRNKIQLSSNALFTLSVSGRVEICVCISNDSCSWQSVSTGSITSPMSWKNSIVVCRELGYFDVYSPILQNTIQPINQANSSLEIYPTTFICDGTESSLIDCASGTSTNTLTHTADAYVNCQSSNVNEKVRLTGTISSDNHGVVEYYVSNAWRTICPDSWDDSDANLLCTSLGFDSGTATNYSRINQFRGPNIETDPSIQRVSCPSTAMYFSQCTPTFGSSCGASTTLAGVMCQSSATMKAGSVRLFSTSTYSTYERVEVFYNGRWGTVCRINWSDDNGDVACKELGGNVDQANVSTTTTFNVQSSLPIWVSAYHCEGTESTLSSCDTTMYPIGYVASNCSHSTDAGLSCPISNVGVDMTVVGVLVGSLIGVPVYCCMIYICFCSIWILYNKKDVSRVPSRKTVRSVALRQTRLYTASTVPSNTTISVPSNTATCVPSSTTTQLMRTTESYSVSVSTPSDPTLCQAAPPSYGEALNHLDVKDPPQYHKEENLLQ